MGVLLVIMPKKNGEPTKAEEQEFMLGRVAVGKRKLHYWLCFDCGKGKGVEWKEDAIRLASEHRKVCLGPPPDIATQSAWLALDHRAQSGEAGQGESRSAPAPEADVGAATPRLG